jgi:hypothetical protein
MLLLLPISEMYIAACRITVLNQLVGNNDRLSGLVVRVPGYRSKVWVRFLALSDFLRSSGSGTGSTQPRKDN